ncbi:MAG TPA: protein kinase [Gemmatimonadaceae bacterium]|nr:protein kinase [Gemmatimonadaceae bacterium]
MPLIRACGSARMELMGHKGSFAEVTPNTGTAHTLEPGHKLGRYRLLELIGEGGMGQVWKAHDDNLDRDVAIKMLLRGTLGHATRRERFRREALVLSRLSHPGVATIFDFDVQDGFDFLVMEYVAGGTLESVVTAGPLSLEKILTMGASIADALDNAHRQGILHRDLKPGNIVLTGEGHPKILDFGLAVLLSGTKESGRLTQPGMVVGSLPYMAPEQLFGEADDARTDIYALGVLLFEMTTGKQPFVKSRPESLMFAIINNAAPSVQSLRPDAPDALDRLITECLRKQPDQRPASAAVVAQTLRGIRDGVPTGALPIPARDVVRAIAVLPLRNLSNDAAQEYFADGMTESIISELARIKALRVISRTSVMAYKGATKAIPEIARELNVDAVLEGSALLIGQRVRVSVQLISARTDNPLWAERYDRDLEDVLALQSELAETVARAIAIQLSPVEQTQLAQRNSVNPEAHLEYLKARHMLTSGTIGATDAARRYAMRALELDPNYALAWCVLADSITWSAIRGRIPAAEGARDAIAAADKALEFDPDLPDAHGSKGIILSHSGDLANGMRHLQKAVELNPGYAAAYNLLGRALYSYERIPEALEATEKSVSLDPVSMMVYTGAGDAYYFARQYEKSVIHYRMALELDQRFDGTHTGLARSLEALGRFDEARAEYEEGRRIAGGVAGPSFGLAHLAQAMGHEAEARRILAELLDARATQVVSAWGLAVLHASLGDVDETFKWLDVAIEEKSPGLLLLRVHPRLDPIRADPRYWPLVKRLGLSD